MITPFSVFQLLRRDGRRAQPGIPLVRQLRELPLHRHGARAGALCAAFLCVSVSLRFTRPSVGVVRPYRGAAAARRADVPPSSSLAVTAAGRCQPSACAWAPLRRGCSACSTARGSSPSSTRPSPSSSSAPPRRRSARAATASGRASSRPGRDGPRSGTARARRRCRCDRRRERREGEGRCRQSSRAATASE